MSFFLKSFPSVDSRGRVWAHALPGSLARKLLAFGGQVGDRGEAVHRAEADGLRLLADPKARDRRGVAVFSNGSDSGSSTWMASPPRARSSTSRTIAP
jgi:hypothetical protein